MIDFRQGLYGRKNWFPADLADGGADYAEVFDQRQTPATSRQTNFLALIVGLAERETQQVFKMSRINKFEDLEVWQMSREICRDLEELFNTTALGNRYSLLNQMDRSSGSIMDNIAEGFGRGGNKEFRYFLSFSRGSCHEFSYEQFKGLSDKCNVQNVKLLSFINYLSRTDYKGIKFK